MTERQLINDTINQASLETANSALRLVKLCRNRREAILELSLWVKQLEQK